MNERLKTMSKRFYDDEILHIDELGIHLKPGVHRQHYNDYIRPDTLESHINYIELGMRKLETAIKQTTEVDNKETNN